MAVTDLIDAGALIVTILIIFWRASVVTGRFEQIGLQQAMEIKELKINVKELSSLIVSLTRVEGRIEDMERRLSRSEQLTDELRRGEGYILPLRRAAGLPEKP